MKKVLIIKIAALGDILMLLPSLRYLKNKDPNTYITLATGNMAQPFLKYFPEIDRVIFINEKRLLAGNVFQKIFEIVSLWFKAFRCFGSSVFIGHSDIKYSILVPFIKHKKFHPIRGRHHTSEYIRHLDSEFSGHLSFPDRVRSPLKFDVVLAPGGARNLMRDDFLRRWPVEYYAKVAKDLTDKNLRVALIGSDSDKWVNPEFADLPVTNMIGLLNLDETLNLLDSSQVLVSHDSGPIHFGNLMGTVVVSIFGPTLAEEKIPLSNPLSFFFQGGRDLPCSPCYDGRNYAICDRPLCMEDVKPKQVLEKVLEILRSKNVQGR